MAMPRDVHSLWIVVPAPRERLGGGDNLLSALAGAGERLRLADITLHDLGAGALQRCCVLGRTRHHPHRFAFRKQPPNDDAAQPAGPACD
jgi:hypothetical protein